MNIPLKKYLLAALAVVVSFAPAVFAQDAKKPPLIEVEKVDFKTEKMPYYDQSQKWAMTEVRFRVKPYAPTYIQDAYLNNVKMTLTLVYPKSLGAVTGGRVTGSAEQREAALEAASEEVGSNAKFSYYRATVAFAGLKIGGASRYVRFFIPGEVVEREIRGGGEAARYWSGSAKPMAYWVSFSYDGTEVPLYKPDGKLMFPMSVGGAAPWARNMTKANFEKFSSDADSSVSDTKGLLMPQTYLPYNVWPKDSPTILREEIQQ